MTHTFVSKRIHFLVSLTMSLHFQKFLLKAFIVSCLCVNTSCASDGHCNEKIIHESIRQIRLPEDSYDMESETSNQYDESFMIDENIGQIRYPGDPTLMQVDRNLSLDTLNSTSFQPYLNTLRESRVTYGGLGIAGSQIGWGKRVFCVGQEYLSNISTDCWINPEIIWSSNETNWLWEGCLSIPGIRAWVERPAEVILRGYRDDGKLLEDYLTGNAARIVQHEMDHVEGLLFPDLAPSSEFIVPQASIEIKHMWVKDWPSPGSYKASAIKRPYLMNELSTEK